MPHRILATALAAIVALAVAAPVANAEWLMPKSQAESFAQSDATTQYIDLGVEDNNISQSCRPSKLSKLNQHKGRRYHRWVCDWVAVTSSVEKCRGTILIVGSAVDTDNTYGRFTLKGARCGPLT